uniref:GRIP-related Arf-binding domain-containing protein n=1 Tax=Hanusia phi TaxID=3032 RepID=A0A7S0HYR7_9CRYP
MLARVDELSVLLRKARMFAASEDFYIDRRLVSNVLISYFDGNKAGSDEVLKLLCSILGMDKDRMHKMEHGAKRLKQPSKWGLYGLLSAPVTTWETITEAEIGQEWVQFLIDEAEESSKSLR